MAIPAPAFSDFDEPTLADFEPHPLERRADEALVHALCEHEGLWRAVDAGAARALLQWQLQCCAEGVVDLGPLCRYVLDVGVPRRAAAVFLVDLAYALDELGLVADVPPIVDAILDGDDLSPLDDPRFRRSWQ